MGKRQDQFERLDTAHFGVREPGNGFAEFALLADECQVIAVVDSGVHHRIGRLVGQRGAALPECLPVERRQSFLGGPPVGLRLQLGAVAEEPEERMDASRRPAGDAERESELAADRVGPGLGQRVDRLARNLVRNGVMTLSLAPSMPP
jgi:hypothetical protein